MIGQAAPLSAEEEARYIALIETAAGEMGLFERNRTETAEAQERAALEAAAKRLPQAESILAATMADAFLLDGLKFRLRDDALVLDETGRELRGATACRIFEADNVYALYVVLSEIVANGGKPIRIDMHGNVGDGLPRLARGSLGQLVRNGYVTVAQDGTGIRVGLGSRTRRMAAKWGIGVPPATADARA